MLVFGVAGVVLGCDGLWLSEVHLDLGLRICDALLVWFRIGCGSALAWFCWWVFVDCWVCWWCVCVYVLVGSSGLCWGDGFVRLCSYFWVN